MNPGDHAAFVASDVYASTELLPAHRADCERSGLTEATIQTARLRTVPPGDLARVVGPRFAARIESALLFPYDGADGFYRAKLFPAVEDGDGHRMRYFQPAGSAPRLYVPPGVRRALADPTVPLLITEGEKKALKASQDGAPCVGIGGLWNWLRDGRLLPDFASIDFCERATVLVPDSDVWTRPDLLQAVYALGRTLEGRGATVRVLKLPAAPDGTKLGLDDSLCAPGASRATLDALPRLDLKHKVFTDCASWFKSWSARKDGGQQASALDLLSRAESARRLHPAQDVADGILSYGLPAGGKLVLITSERKTFMSEAPPAGFALRHADVGTAVSLTRDTALSWLSGAARGSVAAALDGVTEYLARHIAFRDPRAPAWLAAWALGTWCYRGFPAYPYVHVRSAEKACGKTRLLELLADVGFNASPPTAAPTEAFLFREAERRSGTQCFDEAESLAGDDERLITLVSILNVGYRRGGSVPRLEKQGERFVTVEFEVYAPRILAGLAGLKDTLESRALPLVMVRRRRDEPIARVGRETAATAARLREACALACLSRIADILSAYDTARDLLAHEGVDDRAEELMAPLLALALVADGEAPAGNRTKTLLAVARDLGAVRDAAESETETARLVVALQQIRTERGERLRPSELLEALKGAGWDWLRSAKAVAVLLGPLGFASRMVRDGQRVVRAYVLDADVIEDLAARFCQSPTAGEATADEATSDGAEA